MQRAFTSIDALAEKQAKPDDLAVLLVEAQIKTQERFWKTDRRSAETDRRSAAKTATCRCADRQTGQRGRRIRPRQRQSLDSPRNYSPNFQTRSIDLLNIQVLSSAFKNFILSRTTVNA